MIKKIEEHGDIAGFEAGTLLIKYPLSGEFSEEVKFEDHANLLEYEIYAIDFSTQLLELKLKDKNLSPVEGLTTITNHPALLIKPFHELISDKTWWYDQ